MTSMQSIRDILAQPSLAIVGVSRSGKKFGNIALRELRANGYRLFPVHPSGATIEGMECYPSLAAIPEPVGGVFIAVPPAQTEHVVRDAAAAGITRVWMQRGAASERAVKFCADHGISEVHAECILMFLQTGPVVHRAHRWIRGVFGKLPR